MRPTYILGIESSCDDTAAAVLRDGQLLSNCVAGQEAHRRYGGVVPEVASRAHQQQIIPVIHQALQEAGISKTDISAVAFTRGPGLIGSLIVGTTFAKGFALALGIPLLEVHHLQAHVLAHFIEAPKPQFPFLCLTVSGGHTQIVLVKDYLDMEVLGSTIDDAAGEAFDKTGKLLGLDYPAGPLIDKWAQQGEPIFPFPEPNIPDLEFSFSGLKTSVFYQLKKLPEALDAATINDLCASFQEAVIEVLVAKTITAARRTGERIVSLSGGVSCNRRLREAMSAACEHAGLDLRIAAPEYTTDNAAMIAWA
ncbi:MAG: tRNA (adenosine(37)-N6)-threonylcarbamoyltransferase complex transferase subunit TsaD, partial [Phaeodactylibacter sp.]|nr:tRNA (adenosine(37)-N6)-threonylcarbamoyltransferase complex transferase subunit TsaD [Phaeodactylibacter sp.]